MAIKPSVDTGIPLPRRGKLNAVDTGNLRKRVRILANTARLLASEGLDLTPTGSDERAAAYLVSEFAADPIEAAKNVSDKDLRAMTPASLVQADAILTEYGRQIVDNAASIRHTVTNKLILETENPDPRVRLKALELLGKISDVGLFAEKSEITITHKTSDELKEALREKLERLRQPPPVMPEPTVMSDIEDAEFEEVFAVDEPDADTPADEVAAIVEEFNDYDD